MNQATFIGNLTQDATVRAARDGREPFVSFSVAVNRRMKDGTKLTQYVECMKNGDNAALLPYLVRGAKVAVWGRVSCHAYVTRQNQAAASLDLYVQGLELVGAHVEATPAAAGGVQQAPVQGAPLTVRPMPAAVQPAAVQQQQAPAVSPAVQSFAAQVGGVVTSAAPEPESGLPF